MIIAIVAMRAVTDYKNAEGFNGVRNVTLHYTNWCPYCTLMKPVYAEVKAKLQGASFRFSEIDEEIVKTPGINSYPTIIMMDENGNRRQYHGSADVAMLTQWLLRK